MGHGTNLITEWYTYECAMTYTQMWHLNHSYVAHDSFCRAPCRWCVCACVSSSGLDEREDVEKRNADCATHAYVSNKCTFLSFWFHAVQCKETICVRYS
mmetsp:Transcript_65842/g.96435  ORF Transcript_65842/g.96435 Transcript_65842/m.96435 type:complete len:99 (-) Transcript_65842:433-729(-)